MKVQHNKGNVMLSHTYIIRPTACKTSKDDNYTFTNVTDAHEVYNNFVAADINHRGCFCTHCQPSCKLASQQELNNPLHHYDHN